VNKAPFALAFEIIAAMIVAPAERPKLPISKMVKNTLTLSTEKFITAKNKGTVIISIKINSIKLNIYLPKNMLIGSATNFNVSDVWVSSSLTNIWDSPDIAEKNNIIQSNAESISLSAEKAPIENETAVSVTTENNRIAFNT